MSSQRHSAPRRMLLLIILITVLAGAAAASLLVLPRILAQRDGIAADTGRPVPPGLSTATLTPGPTASPTHTPEPPTPTSAVLHPNIAELNVVVDDDGGAITFQVKAQVPPGRRIAEAILWYDTETGHQLQHMAGPLPETANLTYRLDARLEGLTGTLSETQELDYWWLVRDTAGESVRAGGVAHLGPALLSLVTAPESNPGPVEYSWAISETRNYRFHYKPGTEAERDRFLIGSMAEAALTRISGKLEESLDEPMDVYLIPRIFWQGGATYGNKVQLISYLDRNYTGIETWTYFTHEGTHALAQDLLEPKENGGGPDGVLVEGLAVWASDGHYRLEPIDAWAAVIAASDQYLPLADLRAGPFYDFQHETSYIEAASFVKYLVEGYGLDRLKELYGRATGETEHDNELARQLYGKGYTELDAEWLAYLAGLSPTPDQAQTWNLKVRSFDLMRRYESEMDPDARILPSTSPVEWGPDLFQIFWRRLDDPINVTLETALIAAQERLYRGDPEGAKALLDDVEAALGAALGAGLEATGGAATSVAGWLAQDSLKARWEILRLLEAQDRAVLRADAEAYRATLDPGSSLALDAAVAERLQPPFVAYAQEVVRLDLADDGLIALGVVLVHADTIYGGDGIDGQLFAVSLVRSGQQWLVNGRHQISAAELIRWVW